MMIWISDAALMRPRPKIAQAWHTTLITNIDKDAQGY